MSIPRKYGLELSGKRPALFARSPRRVRAADGCDLAP